LHASIQVLAEVEYRKGWMTLSWIEFDPEALPAPSLSLATPDGKALRPGDFRGRSNLVLFFSHQADCAGCRDLVSSLIDSQARLRALDAAVLIIQPEAQAQGEQMAVQYVIDVDDRLREAYARLLPQTDEQRAHTDQPPALLFVLDRYGAPVAAWAGDQPDSDELVPALLEWLEFIGVQCPECGIAEWAIDRGDLDPAGRLTAIPSPPLRSGPGRGPAGAG
jgi:peroxiredoxin